MFVVELEGPVNVSSAAQRGVAERSVQALAVGFEFQGNVMESELLNAEILNVKGEQSFAGAAGEVEVFKGPFKIDEVCADAERGERAVLRGGAEETDKVIESAASANASGGGAV